MTKALVLPIRIPPSAHVQKCLGVKLARLFARFLQELFALAEACATKAARACVMQDLWDQIAPKSALGVPSHHVLDMASVWPVDRVCAIMVTLVKIANFFARLETE